MYAFFFFNDTATTEIYTLSLHDALPIFHSGFSSLRFRASILYSGATRNSSTGNHSVSENLGIIGDRKSTRLNSSHSQISYAVFCLKKKKLAYDLCRSLVGRPVIDRPVAP